MCLSYSDRPNTHDSVNHAYIDWLIETAVERCASRNRGVASYLFHSVITERSHTLGLNVTQYVYQSNHRITGTDLQPVRQAINAYLATLDAAVSVPVTDDRQLLAQARQAISDWYEQPL